MSLLTPRKVKHRKWQRRSQMGKATRKTEINFGSYGLKAQTSGLVTGRQLEAARRAITRFIQKGGKIWIRIFPDKPITIKGSEVRMGGGKGAVAHYATPVCAGTVMFEIDGLTEATAREAFRLAAFKLPLKTKFIAK